MRVGIGYDVHRLEEEYLLILGGVKIPYERGLVGHSDADVLVHAVMDSLLGAMGERDIGSLFPDTDEQYRGIASILLLKQVRQLMEEKGFRLLNIDAVIIAQRPRLASYIPEMVDNLARALQVEDQQLNVKATTTEGLGSLGRGEGIAAQAVSLLQKNDDR